MVGVQSKADSNKIYSNTTQNLNTYKEEFINFLQQILVGWKPIISDLTSNISYKENIVALLSFEQLRNLLQ